MRHLSCYLGRLGRLLAFRLLGERIAPRVLKERLAHGLLQMRLAPRLLLMRLIPNLAHVHLLGRGLLGRLRLCLGGFLGGDRRLSRDASLGHGGHTAEGRIERAFADRRLFGGNLARRRERTQARGRDRLGAARRGGRHRRHRRRLRHSWRRRRHHDGLQHWRRLGLLCWLFGGDQRLGRGATRRWHGGHAAEGRVERALLLLLRLGLRSRRGECKLLDAGDLALDHTGNAEVARRLEHRLVHGARLEGMVRLAERGWHWLSVRTKFECFLSLEKAEREHTLETARGSRSR